MVRKCTIIKVLLVLTTSVNAIYFVNESQRAPSSRSQKYINKCCHVDHYVGRKKTCVKYNDTLNFSNVKIFDKAFNNTGKTLENVFILTTRKFQNETFKKEALDVTLMDFNIYLTESGVLELEVPNAYNRWISVPQDSYCVDYHVADPTQITPRFWAVLSGEEFNKSSLYTTCATSVSCFFLLLVLLVYILLPDLDRLSDKIVMAVVGNLFVAFFLMTIIQTQSLSSGACIAFTLVIYFFLLASFFWINVISFDICLLMRAREIRRRHRERFYFLMYSLYAWGVPLLMTIGLAVLNTVDMRHLPWFVTPRIPEYGCFLQGGVKLLYLYVPMLILNLCNWIFYAVSVYRIYRVRKAVSIPKSLSNCSKGSNMILYRKLSILMGLNWLLEIVNFLYPELKFWYLSDAYNLLIGLVFFIMFVCKKAIWSKLYDRYCTWNKPTWLRSFNFSIIPVRYFQTSIPLQVIRATSE